MPRFVANRLLALIPVLLGIIFVTMLVMDLIPGDPVALMLGENARPEEVATLRAKLGLDSPLLVRYARYIVDVVQGDLGRSILSNRPVTAEIGDVFPHTLRLTLAAMVLAVVLGIASGVISAIRPGGWMDAGVRLLSLIGLSMPIFWLGLVLIYVFAYYLRLFPVGGTGTWRHLALRAWPIGAKHRHRLAHGALIHDGGHARGLRAHHTPKA